jgi:hypothetical protein
MTPNPWSASNLRQSTIDLKEREEQWTASAPES